MLHAEHTVHYFMRREYQLCSKLAARCKVRAAMTAAACAICHYLHCCIRCAHVFSQRKFLHNLFEKGLNKHYHYLVPALYCLLLATKRNEVVNMMGTSHMCTIYVETRNNYGHKRRVKYCYFCTLCAMFLLCAAN